MTSVYVDTAHGPARAVVHGSDESQAALFLGHGAGGGIDAPDLVAVTRAATSLGVDVALIEQPYRVAGRKAPAPAKQLDAAWLAVVEDVGQRWFPDLPVLFGGRSSGARVACRTAETAGAFAVLCLAFPVHPPGKPDKSRHGELDEVQAPVLVVQGDRDPFGQPTPSVQREVVGVPGDHSLKSDVDAVVRAVDEWLERMLRLMD